MDTQGLLTQRGMIYGNFQMNAEVSQNLKAVIYKHSISALRADQREAIDQICLKLSRIVTGDPDYPDNWDDIAGYAKLVADRVR